MKILTLIPLFVLQFILQPHFFENNISKKEYLHPVHVSFTTIEYNEKDKEFKILFRIFVDDFDLAIKKKYGKNLNISQGKWGNNYVNTINSYIKDEFKLTYNNNKEIELKFNKHEIKEQAIWLYYTAKQNINKGKFKIFNNLLINLYADQKNLLIFVFRNSEKALQFNPNNINQEISF